MANYGYIKITGETQGLLSANCSSQSSIETDCPNKIKLLSYSHSMSKIGDTKHRTYHQINITKEIDESSHLLARALSTGEAISCTIQVYRSSSEGPAELFYTAKIDNGIISDMTVDFPHADLNQNQTPQELLTLRYQKITWSHHLAGSDTYISWCENSEWNQ